MKEIQIQLCLLIRTHFLMIKSWKSPIKLTKYISNLRKHLTDIRLSWFILNRTLWDSLNLVLIQLVLSRNGIGYVYHIAKLLYHSFDPVVCITRILCLNRLDGIVLPLSLTFSTYMYNCLQQLKRVIQSVWPEVHYPFLVWPNQMTNIDHLMFNDSNRNSWAIGGRKIDLWILKS